MSAASGFGEQTVTSRLSGIGLFAVVLVYLHNTLPYLTMMPRVNVDEPWLMERAYQVMRSGIPSQPMLGLRHAYLLQVGYGYLLALWMALFGVGIFQARLLGVGLGLGIVLMVVQLAWSIRTRERRRDTSGDPWNARTLVAARNQFPSGLVGAA